CAPSTRSPNMPPGSCASSMRPWVPAASPTTATPFAFGAHTRNSTPPSTGVAPIRFPLGGSGSSVGFAGAGGEGSVGFVEGLSKGGPSLPGDDAHASAAVETQSPRKKERNVSMSDGTLTWGARGDNRGEVPCASHAESNGPTNAAWQSFLGQPVF